MREISCLAEKLYASQEGSCYISPHESALLHKIQLYGHKIQLNGHKIQLYGHKIQLYGHKIQLYGHKIQLYGHKMQLYGHKIQLYGHKIQLYRHKIQLYGHKIQLYGHKIQLYGHKIQLYGHKFPRNQRHKQRARRPHGSEGAQTNRILKPVASSTGLVFVLLTRQYSRSPLSYLRITSPVIIGEPRLFSCRAPYASAGSYNFIVHLECIETPTFFSVYLKRHISDRRSVPFYS
jgi:hypothetical protein